MYSGKNNECKYGGTYIHIFFLAVGLFRGLHPSSPSFLVSSLSAPSPLVNTKWNLRLDVGLQPGTWMSKRFPGWAESGTRLPLNVDVEFTKQVSAQRVSLVGRKDETFVLAVSGTSTFVSELGQQEVTFTDGGWCIQRPTANIRNAEGSMVKPEGLLNFWLDCKSGAKKRDAEVFPNTRIFFTTGVWDDPAGLKKMQSEYEAVLKDLDGLVDATRKIREDNNDDNNEGGINNVVNRLRDFGTLVDNSKDFDQLQGKKAAMEKAAPPLGASESGNGVKIAPTGSLVIKGIKIPDWLPGSEYLILGTFSAKAL